METNVIIKYREKGKKTIYTQRASIDDRRFGNPNPPDMPIVEVIRRYIESRISQQDAEFSHLKDKYIVSIEVE